MYVLKSPMPQVMSNIALRVCGPILSILVTAFLLKAHGSYICNLTYFVVLTASCTR